MANETKNKFIDDFTVIDNIRLSGTYSLLKLRPNNYILADCKIKPGQFVQVKTPTNATMIRRPISICNVDFEANLLWLLVRQAGPGTEAIISVSPGDCLNLIFPLGHGFTTTINADARPVLIGGGVGVAPLLYLGRQLGEKGIKPTFLLGARSSQDLLLLNEFEQIGDVCVSTDDGTSGHHGVATTNPIVNEYFSHVYCCGPMPMMRAVVSIYKQKNIDCEVSLENVMGCGIGACLCCVEETKDSGNVCVCTQGPVFKSSRLTW